MGKEKIAFQSDRAEIIGDLYFCQHRLEIS